MAEVDAFITEYLTLDPSTVLDSPIPALLSARIISNHLTLLSLVNSLQSSLLSDNPTTLTRAITLLARTITSNAAHQWDRNQVKTLISFFVGKLLDLTLPVDVLQESIEAIRFLLKQKSCGTAESIEIVNAILKLPLTKYTQSTRYTIYTLIDLILSHQRPALKRLGKAWIKGYCVLVEGEKDPRNLMISFGIIKVVLLEFDLEDCIEDLFDITFCYFPITFTPPPDDPYGITSEDLVLALRQCLSATPHFGPLALPLFLDKLQAASEKAKRQTMAALIDCFPIYGAQVSGEWAGRFSEALSIEVFHATDPPTLELALQTFTSLFSTLYPDQNPTLVNPPPPIEASEADVKGIGIKVVQNSLDELNEPDKSNAAAAVRILVALMLSSARLTNYVLSATLPQLLALYKDPDEFALRPSILTHISTLLSTFSTPIPSPTSTYPLPLPNLNLYKDSLLSLLTSATRSSTTPLPALSSLSSLLVIPNFLVTQEQTWVVSTITDVLLASSAFDSTGGGEGDEALKSLVRLSRINEYQKILEETTLPRLFALIPIQPPSPREGGEEDKYKISLKCLKEICVTRTLFSLLVIRLLARLDGICSLPSSSSGAKMAHHLLLTLGSVLRVKRGLGGEEIEDVKNWSEKIMEKIFGIFLRATIPSKGRKNEDEMVGVEEGETVAIDQRLLVDAGKVVEVVVQCVDVERQSKFSKVLNEAFHQGDLRELLGEGSKELSLEAKFAPLSSESSQIQQDTVVLFSSAILAMRPNTAVSAKDLIEFLRHFLFRVTENGVDEIQIKASVELIGQTVNKRMPDLTEFLTDDLEKFWKHQIANVDVGEKERKAALRTWAWVAKGLVVRSDQRGYEFVDRILSLFHDAVLGRVAAQVLGLVVEESDRVVSKENFAVIRLLWKQRFFSFLLPKLVIGYKEGGDQSVYLMALSTLLQHIPRAMSLSELPKLLPLLITSLDLPDSSLRANVIETLSVLAKEVPKEMENQINGIVNKILPGILVSKTFGVGGVPLRIASLNFLAVLPDTISYSTLHSQKATVLKELGKALDDPKRDVRRVAVPTRSKWFLYSGSV